MMRSIADYGNSFNRYFTFGNTFKLPTNLIRTMYQPDNVKDVSVRQAVPFFLKYPRAMPLYLTGFGDWRWFENTGGGA